MVPGPRYQRLHRPPLIGLVALFCVMLALPLTHSLSMLSRRLSGAVGPFWAYAPLGMIGLALLIIGIRRNRETSGTLLGFVSGMLLWTGWSAYAFRANELALALPMQQLSPATRWPNNLLYIEGSLGICIVTLLFFVFNRDTRCNAFLWLQRRLRLSFGSQASAQDRNFCRITFIETVYVTWFCYAVSLILSDPRLIGHANPWHYGITALLAGWGLYLLWRLTHYTRIMAAIRYAIPVKAILWIVFGETLPKYGWYEEVWLRPFDYPWTMATVLAIFAVILGTTAAMPKRRTDHLQTDA